MLNSNKNVKNKDNYCSHCNDGHPLPHEVAEMELGGGYEMYLSVVEDGRVWLTAEPDDPWYTFAKEVRFCPWCGRELRAAD